MKQIRIHHFLMYFFILLQLFLCSPFQQFLPIIEPDNP